MMQLETSMTILISILIRLRSLLLSAVMSLQCISGQRAIPTFATKGDASKKIRAGMPIGAKVFIYYRRP